MGDHDALAHQRMHDRVERDFTLHPPSTVPTAARMDDMRDRFRRLAHDVVEFLPPGREQLSALTSLEVACFHAIAAIARSDENVGVDGP